jgi:curved DNA-binding protein CbpA
MRIWSYRAQLTSTRSRSSSENLVCFSPLTDTPDLANTGPALKFHPDRNPGEEEAAKEKFHIIQNAHEILSDPELKAKVDAHRQQRASRYGTASGIRGNPWQGMAQEVNQKYGAPPSRTRPPMPPRQPGPTAASASSTKHWDWAQKAARTKTESMRAHMEAWERARPQPKASQPGTRPPPPPPPREPQPPRTASQARKQEASFGNRKSGYAAGSAMDDEPPAKNQHYPTGPPPAVPPRKSAPGPGPTSTFGDPPPYSDPVVETIDRQRTPYAANVGEKTNVFENVNVNRAKSMRDAARKSQDTTGDAPPAPQHRQRSASTGSDNFTKPPFTNATGQQNFQFQSRASARYTPHSPDPNSAPPTASFPDNESAASSASSTHGEEPIFHSIRFLHLLTITQATVNGHASGPSNGTKVYGFPWTSSLFSNATPTKLRVSPRRRTPGSGIPVSRSGRFEFPAYKTEATASPTPSGDGKNSSPNPFETKLQAQIQELLSQPRLSPPKQGTPGTGGSASGNNGFNVGPFGNGVPGASVPRSSIFACSVSSGIATPKPTSLWANGNANKPTIGSFSVPLDDDFKTQSRFARNSEDNINTRFVSDDRTGASGFQFSAGTSDDSFVRAKQRARGQGSPLRNSFTAPPEPGAAAGVAQPDAGVKKSDFKPEQWENLGPEIFVPPQAAKGTASPTRPLRPIKKPKGARAAAGAATVTDDEASGEDRAKENGGGSGINGTRSPNAMDIDTPPPEPASVPSGEPRIINVEPTKPEWRPGHVNGGSGMRPASMSAVDPSLGAGLKMPNLKPNNVGSEDTDDLRRPIFAEFNNVEPFAPPKATGLDSFADLSTNLPFPSRPSTKLHLDPDKETTPPRPHKVAVPTPPQAPRPPPGLCVPGSKAGVPPPQWAPYAAAFEQYMKEWYVFNRKMTDHFAARQRLMENRGFSWVNARGDQGVDDYNEALETDKYVRQRWVAACDAHESHFKEFCRVRQMVLGGLMN